MFRNLIWGSLLVPFGAALPLLVLFAGGGLFGAIFTASPMPLSMGVGQSFYILFGAYFFGWPTALVTGAANGIVWLVARQPYMRLLLSPLVGFVAAMISLGFMLFVTTRPLEALPALLGYGALAAIGSFVSALVIFSSSRERREELLPA